MENVSHTYPGRQYDTFNLLAENGRDKKSRTNADLKWNLGVSIWAGDHYYCRTFTRQSQLQDRLEISAPERFHGMETMPTNYFAQQNMPNIRGRTGNRPICFKFDKSASKLLFLKAGSQQSWQRCSSTEMVWQEPVYSFHLLWFIEY